MCSQIILILISISGNSEYFNIRGIEPGRVKRTTDFIQPSHSTMKLGLKRSEVT